MNAHKANMDSLLQRFYNGETTRQEEMQLYLMLLDEPADSAYAPNRELLCTLMEQPATVVEANPDDVAFMDMLKHSAHTHIQSLQSRKGIHRAHWLHRHVSGWMVAATLTLLVSVGIGIHRHGVFSDKMEISMNNGREIMPEEAATLVSDIFAMMDAEIVQSRVAVQEAKEAFGNLKSNEQ